MPRETADCYYIRNPKGHSWARVFLLEGVRPNHNQTDVMHWGYISVVSDFGSFGAVFGSMGMPLREFLRGLNFGYAMQKMMGNSYRQFDFDASVKNVRRIAREGRRNGGLSKDEARELYNLAEELELDGPMSGETMIRRVEADLSATHPRNSEIYEWAPKEIDNPQAVGFWREIWPLLLAEFEAEKQVQTA